MLRMAASGPGLLLWTALLLTAAPGPQGAAAKGKSASPLRFTQPLYNTTIKENSAPRTYLETAKAKMGIQMADLSWEIRYKLVSGDEDGLFQTEAVKVGDFCFLRVKTRSGNSALLNREVRDSYVLTVEATESASDLQAKTKLLVRVLDTNDLKPLFYPASYAVTIREDAPLQSSVVRVSATDADDGSNADFYYSLTARAHPFSVDPFSGTLSLLGGLNFTRAPRYDLTVLAEDRAKKISGVQKFGNVAKVTVSVQQAQRRAPLVAPPSKLTVSPDGKVSVDVEVEAGLRPVESLRIVSGDPHQSFEIVPSPMRANGFQVVSTKRIIWSQTPFGLNLSLQAKDRSSPSLLSAVTRVHIPAVHYRPLTFTEDTYTVSVSEFSPPGTHVVRVSVDSPLFNVTFGIRSNADSAAFKINPKTGTLVTTEKLDYETKARYRFDVVANQGEAQSQVVVEVSDENDNSPQFSASSYQASLDENSPVGSSVLRVTASDRDAGKNGLVTYALANSGPLPFAIDPFTGVISTSQNLDYELMKRRYHLRVWASDSGSPFSQVSECPVTVTLNNLNDNVPLFERVDCNATLPPDFPAGQTLLQLSAIDVDELQQLRYVIESGNEQRVFDVEGVSGGLTLRQPLPRGAGSFTLRVVASDGKHRSQASVVRITVTEPGDEAAVRCQETGIFKQLTDKLIESIKPVLGASEEEVFSDVYITNRHSPKFDPGIPGSIDLAEDQPLLSPILRFDATDGDTGFNSKLVYAISGGNQDGCFSIDTFSGHLHLVCSLDRESKEFYILNITVYDLGTPQTSAWKFMAVNVIDVNDNPPLFDQPRHVVHLPENTEVDSLVFKAQATDPDTGGSQNIRYRLLTGSDLFRVDEASGEVRVAGRLDRESRARHDLHIQAREADAAGPRLFSSLHLVVVLQDVNDNPPKFVPKVYRVQVPEDVPVGTLLLWVESVDPDLGSGGLVTYNLKNTEGGTFQLDPSTGALTLERELDFERRPSFNLTVRAVDHGLPRSLSSSCFVEIRVLDVNENLHRPVFSQFVYEGSVMEDAAVGTSVLTLTASDRDLGRDGVVRYHIHSGSGLGVFAIHEETGAIGTLQRLDRESVPHYWLCVSATDLGSQPLVSWTHVYLEVADVNDNAPELSQPIYFATVEENSAPLPSVVRVLATDLDASSQDKLSFHLPQAHRTAFDLDPKTGVIRTLSALDREDRAEHTIEVVVSDNGEPPLRSTATVVIGVLDHNDNRPKFTDKLFHVRLPARRQRDGPGRVCRMVARDDDEGLNAAVTYQLQDAQDARFAIDPQSGQVTAHGDFWAGNYTILTIKAVDQGSPPQWSTSRLDIEWSAPSPASKEPISFDEPHFTFAVMETEPVTHMVGIITTETHQLRWFDIIAGDEDQDFDIQRNSGTVSIARRLQAARRSNYNLTVRVTDGHHSATAQAYIRVLDMNEHRPVFLKPFYQVRVPEDTSPWKDILQIGARDADANSKLVFSVSSSLPSDSARFFHLDPKSGVLVLTEALDYEAVPVHTLVVMVRDQEIPVKRNLVKVLVQVEDCNDHSPVFLSPQYQVNVSGTAFGAGQEVLRVKALDRDTGSNADISYSLISGNTDGVFSIDAALGSISASEPLHLQPERRFQLTVKATDQGFPQRSDLCSVQVLVRGSALTPPAFSAQEYLTEISESSGLGTSVLALSASSPAAAVRYGIESGDPGGTFGVNPFTGLISLRKHLDFEQCSSYRLRVAATTSAGAASAAEVYVYVSDENDNAPVFRQRAYLGHVSEAAHPDSMVMGEGNVPLVVRAQDADRDSNSLLLYQIVEEEAARVFRIEPSTGALSLASAVDFEAQSEYRFTVQARDSGEPSLMAAQAAAVTVRVLDLNDCPPQFTSHTYRASVIAPALPDSEVVRVSARDPDSSVTYSITEGNLHNAFSIQPSTGVITISNVSHFASFYQLGVRASDGLYKDFAVVTVNATNVTRSGLGFERAAYSAAVAENTETVQSLAALKPSGCFLNEPLLYSLLNPAGRFSISESSGLLETTGVPFDREETDAYDLVVKLQDTRQPPRTATALVKVFVDDVNDNAPQFLNLPFSMMISDDSEPGDVLYQATAVDRDLGENASVTYSLEEDFGLFRIDPDVGDISLQRPLDFEASNKYVLTVLAVDGGDPGLGSGAQLSIQIRNRTNPVFQTLLYPLKVPENVPPFTTILHVQARNPEGYRLIYNLQEENASRHFHIDFKSGVLTVSNPLDYESQSMHVLTVRATDSVTGAFSEASIEIEVEDVNDNAPLFSKLRYAAEVAEGLPVGSSVTRLLATDLDSGRNKDLTFQMVQTGGNETQFFEVDPRSGWILTKLVLDHEDTGHFSLKVRAVDNGTPPLSSEAQVFVDVTDVNDNPPDFDSPLYRASLDEMAKCGHIVIKIQASDPDAADANNLRYKILSGNEERYFKINESSGIISFANVCKRNLEPYYNLTVAVSDGVFQKSARVDVDMISSNRHSPHFKQSLYEAELAENAEPGTRVIRLAAVDPDDGPFGSVDYTIINKLADETFAIGADGQIVTTQALDRENPAQRVVAIKVMAKDGGGKVAFCTVKIILTDQNDNVPEFKASEYQVSIRSDVNKGSPVIQIVAYDADDGKNADVTYAVEEAEEVTEDVIEINPFTGTLSVKESLEGMENRIFNFKVKARDGSPPFYNSSVPVQLKVLPPEVPLPKFSEPLYSFSAAEDAPVGTEIGSVRADADVPLIYSLVNGNTADSNKDKVFGLDQESGTVLLQKSVDHEKTKWYQIDVMAQGQRNGTQVASLVSVNIQVQDVNDNRPVFDADPYRAFLAENMPAGTTVIQVTANDPDADANGQVMYSLESLPGDADVGQVFSIHPGSGWITTLRPADCEATRLFRFKVLATDGGGEAKLSSGVVVEVTLTDDNDNAPRFSQELYHGSVVESSGPGEVIVSMTTTDDDVSLENRLVTCYITDGDPLGQFAIVQQDEGQWGLIVKEPLDRETTDRYTLKVTATDGKYQSQAGVELQVLDINDNSPQCEQLLYTESVMENSPSSTFVLKVVARDADVGANGQISFSLHGAHAHSFHLDPRTGELFTLAALDREQEAEHRLVARAADGAGRSCHSDILLMVHDVNDNAPRFSSSRYQVTVFDNTTALTPLAVIYATDPDAGINSEVRYSLLEGDGGYFSLDEFSGILRLERALSAEAPPAFELKVRATDRGLPRQLSSLATVLVEVVSLDDFQPVFLSPHFGLALPESLDVGSQVLSLSPPDAAGSEPVRYRIVSGNQDGRFLLDTQTGLLTLAAPLDYEVAREYFLSVEGSRGKSLLSDITTVVINVTDANDNAPVFGAGIYSAQIPEDMAPGGLVMKVTAVDDDGPINNLLRYSIVSGDPQQQFTIHPRSGEISVCAALDREEVPDYSLTVQAADEGWPPLSSAVLVSISVTDVNDNAPTFSQPHHSLLLQEGEAAGSSILQLLVTDRDTPTNGPPFSFHIVSGNEDRRFQVDQGGLLSLAAPLRRKQRAHHQLKIQVTDSGLPPLSSICVVEVGVAERSRFPPSAVPLEVFVTTAGGAFSEGALGRLHASDRDPQDTLSFRLASESPAGSRFSVDAADGRIWARERLEEGSYALNVSVTDGRLDAWAAVSVTLWAARQRALDAGLGLQLTGLTPQEFLGDHWRGLQRALAQELELPRHELHLASMQVTSRPQLLEVLLVHRPPLGPPRTLPASRLPGIVADLEDALKVSVLRVRHDGCVGGGCPPRGCRSAVRLTADTLSHFTSARATYITPPHAWESVCPCNESALRFQDASSYLRFVHLLDEDTMDFRVSLSFRTLQRDAAIMSTAASHWGRLQVIGGELEFVFDCGGVASGRLRAASAALSDGQWHTLVLEVNSSSLRLTLDQRSSASTALPSPCRMLRSHGALLFGSAPEDSTPHAGVPSFVGCMDHMELNGEPIRVGDTVEWTGPGSRRVFGVYQCCSSVKPCDHNICLNGGSCQEDGSGGSRCRCVGSFHGERCQLTNDSCSSQPCDHGSVCVPKDQGYVCNCSLAGPEARCHNLLDACSPNRCAGGLHCRVTGRSFSCEALPQVSPLMGYVELMVVSAGVLGLLLLVAIFVFVRRRYVRHKKKKKPACVQDSNGYFPPSLGGEPPKVTPMEMSSLMAPANDLDHAPFRSLRPRGRLGGSAGGGASPRSAAPAVCSVAPNLPPAPPSTSDNDSIRKSRWDLDYEVYPADPDYFGRPSVQEFPQFDIVDDAVSTSTVDSRRNSRFGGFPFPLERCDRRAPLPPCYSNQNLDDFLGADGLPLPRSQCPNEYTAISYYPTQHARSMDNVSSGYKRLSMRLSVAMPSYAEHAAPPPPPPPPPATAQPQTRAAGQNPRSLDGSSMVESDYGSCEEVMF